MVLNSRANFCLFYGSDIRTVSPEHTAYVSVTSEARITLGTKLNCTSFQQDCIFFLPERLQESQNIWQHPELAHRLFGAHSGNFTQVQDGVALIDHCIFLVISIFKQYNLSSCSRAKVDITLTNIRRNNCLTPFCSCRLPIFMVKEWRHLNFTENVGLINLNLTAFRNSFLFPTLPTCF